MSEIEKLVEANEGGIGQAYMAGCQNFQGFPFSVWVLDCDDAGALDILKALAKAGRMKELMSKGKFANLPPSNQIDRWVAECRTAGTRPVAVAPIPAHRAMKVAKAVDRRVFHALRKEPSPGEFWVIVITGGAVSTVAFPKPDPVLGGGIIPV